MDAYTPLINGALLAVFTFALAWLGKGRFDAMNRRFDRLEGEVAELRSMIMQIAIALGTKARPETG